MRSGHPHYTKPHIYSIPDLSVPAWESKFMPGGKSAILSFGLTLHVCIAMSQSCLPTRSNQVLAPELFILGTLIIVLLYISTVLYIIITF